MAVSNEEVAAVFEELADLLEIEEANPFRVRAYRNAARTVKGLGRELEDLIEQGDDLTKLPGIGKDLAGKIAEIIKTGTAGALRELHRDLPRGLEQLLKLPGLGPKRVKALYDELGISDLKRLEAALDDGRLRTVSGFGPKSEQSLREALAARREKKKRIPLGAALEQAEALERHLGRVRGVSQVVTAGSYRRGRETVGDLDILVTTGHAERVLQKFVDFPRVTRVVSHGTTRATVILEGELQVDLRVVAQESFGAALHYFTGSRAHNIHIRRLGQQSGLKINEYGVFEGDRRIAGETEESVFRAVGLPFIEPELREDRGEIGAARSGRLPALVAAGDLLGDLHVRAAGCGVEALARAARKRDLKYLAIADRVVRGGDFDEEKLAAQLDEVDRCNERLKGIRLFKGAEVDITENGNLALSEDLLGRLDLVIGAVNDHYGLSRTRQTRRLLRAMEHRCFSILAHPSCRLLGKRPPCELDMERLLSAAQARGCLFELSSDPVRLDLIDTYCRMARDAQVGVCISSDADSPETLEQVRLGLAQARRGWLEAKDVFNTQPADRIARRLRQLLG